VAAGCPGEPRERVANLQGSEHHRIVVLVRAGTRENIGLANVTLIAAAVLANVEDALRIVGAMLNIIRRLIIVQ
jgi:hypothetical protein